MLSKKISIYEKNTCDKFVAKTSLTILLFTLFVWLLNFLDIFKVDTKAMAICSFTSFFAMAVSIIIYQLKLINHLKRLNYSWIAAGLYLITITVFYSYLTFHVTLGFLLPAIIFNIYGDKKLTKGVIMGTIVSMIISHILSLYLCVIPQEPFTDMRRMLLFGLLPKILIFLSVSYAINYQTIHNEKMLKKVYSYANEMSETQEHLIISFAEICESKSEQTGQHIKRVSHYVDIMAEELKIDDEERKSLMLASMMHDVGKLNIPNEILNKKGKLTSEEYEEIKKHTKYGYELLKNSPGRTMQIAAEIALNHHERWDGTGYNKIEGQYISLYSRIVAIADVFDALVSERSYKVKWKPDAAFSEIVSQRGKQFDPKLVDTFVVCYPKFLEVLNKYS